MSSFYSAWRENGGPTQHSDGNSVANIDALETGFVIAFASLGLCFFLIVPGHRGKARLYFILRMVISLFVGSAIVIGALGQDWEQASIETSTPYKAFTSTTIRAKVGFKIGLTAINITLKGIPSTEYDDSSEEAINNTETIDYNERFHWKWRQGRGGFGPYAGKFNRDFRAAQSRGIPLPILWIAEYFTLDGGSIRWGRSYRMAGWYANQVLWSSFALWIVSNLLTNMVPFFAGVLFVLTGTFILASVTIWSSVRYGVQPLIIPFEDGSLVVEYGPSFWLVLSAGIVSFIYGAFIIALDVKIPHIGSNFFGTSDARSDHNQYYCRDTENNEKSLQYGRSKVEENGDKKLNTDEEHRFNYNAGERAKKNVRQKPAEITHSTAQLKNEYVSSSEANKNGIMVNKKVDYNNEGLQLDDTEPIVQKHSTISVKTASFRDNCETVL